ncbi:MAG: TSUP family transporter [Pseudomonadota bacterium]
MEPLTIIILSFASFTAGFIDSIAGGGGLILIPSLLLAGLPAQAALGTNKFGAFFGTSTALLNFVKNGKIIWKIVGVGIPFSLLGAVIGAKAVLVLDQQTTARMIILLLPFTAVILFLPKKQIKTSATEFTTRNLWLHIPLSCLVIGFYDGFYGPATGAFLIFVLYFFLGLHLVNASAAAKAFNLCSNVGSLITFALAGQVWYALGLFLAGANMLGGYLGSRLAITRGQKMVRYFLLVVFAILFVTLIAKFWL